MPEPWQYTEERYLEECCGDEDENVVIMRLGAELNPEYLCDDDPWCWVPFLDMAMKMTPNRAVGNRRLLECYHPMFRYGVITPK